MTDRRFVYFADPMCSWCWGFSPTITKVVEKYGADIDIQPLMGGLRAGNQEVLDQKGKAYIREHWEHVQKASDQPFDFTFFDRDDFIYDTEPACRAVVTMRRTNPTQSMAYLARIHRAFYADGIDVTKPDVLATLAAEFGLEESFFLEEFESEDTRAETQGDFAVTHQAQIPGFPTIIAGANEGDLTAITTGYLSWPAVEQRIESWLAPKDPENPANKAPESGTG